MDTKHVKKKRRPFSPLLTALYILLCLVCCCALALLMSRRTPGTAENRRELSESFDNAVNNMKSSALEGLTYIRKIYRIPENALTAPEPDPACFGSTTDPAVIQQVVDSAATLLDGQETFWSPDIDYVEAELALSGWVDWLRSQAAALDAPICDFWSIFARMTNAQRRDLYIDGLHPRPEGHRLMALTAAAALRKFAAGGTHL